MTLADRIAAMTADLPQPITVGELRRYGAGPDGRHRHAFDVCAGGESLAEVAIIPRSAPQEHLDGFALAIQALLGGSEHRVEDAEIRLARCRAALEERALQLAAALAKLDAFEVGPAVRGEFYAIEDAKGGVWLAGRPSSAAWGLHFRSWADLARDRPGLRPCGTCKSVDNHGPVEVYIVMRPIADLKAKP